MFLNSRSAAAFFLATLFVAARPADAASGDVINSACVAHEIVEEARRIDYPAASLSSLLEAAAYLPHDEAVPLLIEARGSADVLADQGFGNLVLAQVAMVMSE